jgi:hypothetical protein
VGQVRNQTFRQLKSVQILDVTFKTNIYEKGNDCLVWTQRATKGFSELSARKSVALSIGTPLCPYGIAYRRHMDYSLEGYFKQTFEVRCVVSTPSWYNTCADLTLSGAKSLLQAKSSPEAGLASRARCTPNSSGPLTGFISEAVHLNDFWYKSKSFKARNVQNGSTHP